MHEDEDAPEEWEMMSEAEQLKDLEIDLLDEWYRATPGSRWGTLRIKRHDEEI